MEGNVQQPAQLVQPNKIGGAPNQETPPSFFSKVLRPAKGFASAAALAGMALGGPNAKAQSIGDLVGIAVGVAVAKNPNNQDVRTAQQVFTQIEIAAAQRQQAEAQRRQIEQRNAEERARVAAQNERIRSAQQEQEGLLQKFNSRTEFDLVSAAVMLEKNGIGTSVVGNTLTVFYKNSDGTRDPKSQPLLIQSSEFLKITKFTLLAGEDRLIFETDFIQKDRETGRLTSRKEEKTVMLNRTAKTMKIV
jgi:hypothetical protein